MEWKSRKFLGTAVLVVAYIVQANVKGFVIPELAIQAWLGWLTSETVVDTVRTVRQSPPPKPPKD